MRPKLSFKQLNGRETIFLVIYYKSTRAVMTTDISVPLSAFNSDAGLIVDRKYLKYNNRLREIMELAEEVIDRIKPCPASEIKQHIEDKMNGKGDSFLDLLSSFADKHTPQTSEVYMQTYRRIQSYIKDKGIYAPNLSNLNYEWLVDFDNWLARTNSINAKSIHLRNIRAVFNYAIANDLTDRYPFKKFKIKHEKTRKRNLTISELRTLCFTDYQDGILNHTRDIFLLMVMMRGINMADLMALDRTSIRNGYIVYRRAKTSAEISILLDSHMVDIIEQHKGVKGLLDITDRFSNKVSYISSFNKRLKRMADMVGIDKPFSSYYARHTWASVASEIGIGVEVIGRGLGHSFGADVTNIYINYDQRIIDDASARVIECIYN